MSYVDKSRSLILKDLYRSDSHRGSSFLSPNPHLLRTLASYDLLVINVKTGYCHQKRSSSWLSRLAGVFSFLISSWKIIPANDYISIYTHKVCTVHHKSVRTQTDYGGNWTLLNCVRCLTAQRKRIKGSKGNLENWRKGSHVSRGSSISLCLSLLLISFLSSTKTSFLELSDK